MKKLIYGGVAVVACLIMAVGIAMAEKEATVSIDQVPAKVKEAIQQQTQGATLKEIEQEQEEGKTVYEVEAVKDGKEFEFTVTSDGKVVENEDEEKENEEGHEGNEVRFDFDKESPGSLPAGWKVETTHPAGQNATWETAPDDKAPSGKQVLTLTKVNHSSGDAFNLCWTDQVKFKDGELEVSMRANAGNEDQGGGLIWRAKDANNYYICRYNPLEENYRLYFVRDGARKQIANATGIKIPAGEWVELKVTHKGDAIVCKLNGKELLKASDATIPDVGGVGFWTKADAATSFDSLEIETPGVK